MDVDVKDIETLELFNDKADYLMHSPYINKMNDNKILLNINMNKGIFENPTVSLPEQSFIDALILTLRFFVQDNEEISIRNLVSIYEFSNLDTKYTSRFSNIRNNILRYLNTKCLLKELGIHYTRKEVFEIFVYGNYAHFTKRKEYQRKKKMSLIFPFTIIYLMK